MRQTFDINGTDCLREIHRIGSTEIINICSGAHTVIPWGSADWVGEVSPLVVAVPLVVGLYCFIKWLIKDIGQ